MASDSRRQSRDSQKATPKARPTKPRKNILGRFVLAIVLLGGVVWFLPVIVAKTPLFAWILRTATKDLNGRVTVQSVSLGWLSPIEVRGLEVADHEGQPLLALPMLTGNRSLAVIACNYANLGHFDVQSPQVNILLRDNGTNVEDLLVHYLAPKKKPDQAAESSLAIRVSLRIIDGVVSVTDQLTGQRWQAERLNAAFDMSQGPEGVLAGSIETHLPDVRHPGKIAGGLKMAAGAGEASLSLTEIPLAVSRALAARFSPGSVVVGRLSTEIRASWGNADGRSILQAGLLVSGFSMTAPVLQSDALQTDQLRAACQIAWQADRLDIEKATLECDLANVSLSGVVPLGQTEGFSLSNLGRQRQECSGRIDVAKLAGLMPATLRLRRDMRIDSGHVQWALSSRPDPRGAVWHGQLESSNLTATANGRQIAWQQPIVAVFDAHETPQGPVVDNLRCESDFLKIQAAGTPDDLTATWVVNLQQLTNRLGQFVELAGCQFAGEGTGKLSWKRNAERQFAAGAELQFNGFQWVIPHRVPWREEALLAFFSANGQTDLSANTRIDAASLTLKAGADQIEAQLTQPVASLHEGGVWPVRLRMQGQLQSWPARLALWLPMNECRMAGTYALEADGAASSKGVALRQCRLAAAPLTVASPWLNLNEPRVDLEAAGSWSQEQRRLQVEPAVLRSSALEMQANNIVVAVPESGPMELAGTVKYQGDVGRLQQWWRDAGKAPAWRLAGRIVGDAQLQQTGETVRGATGAEIANFGFIDAAGQTFSEPVVRLSATGDYNTKSQVLQLSECQLVSSAVAARAAGHIAPVEGRNNAHLDAQVRYDMERLTALLRPCLGPKIQLAGRGETAAFYRGPFSLAAGSAAAGLKWDGANIYGFRSGPGELKGTLANGIVAVQPLDLAVNQGRVHLAPQFRVAPNMEFSLPAGPLAQKIQIDPVMCGSGLQYIAPVLAGVATAQGAFSIELDRCRLPIGDVAKGDLAGRFIVHSISIGPGSLIRELAVFMGREAPAQLRRESVVPFRMEKGRVYHDNLELLFPDFTVRSRGSVGVDQTLDLMLQMPVPPKWIEKNPLAAQALRNQIISVPLRGTLAKPQLDQRVMQDLTRQFLQKAAGSLIEGELNRLFGAPK